MKKNILFLITLSLYLYNISFAQGDLSRFGTMDSLIQTSLVINDVSSFSIEQDFRKFKSVNTLIIEGGNSIDDSIKIQYILDEMAQNCRIINLHISTNYDISKFKFVSQLNWYYDINYPSISESILYLDSLKFVNIDISDLSSIPEVIFKLYKIESLTISFAHIRDLNGNRWLNLQNLQTLNLEFDSYIDSFEYLPRELFLIPNLKSLKLVSPNNIYFPWYLPRFSNLHNLEVRGKSLYYLDNTIRGCPYLESFILDAKQIDNIPWHLLPYCVYYPNLQLKMILERITIYDIIQAIDYTIRLSAYKGEKQLISPMKWRRLKKKLLKTYRRDMPAENFYNEYQQIIFREQ